MGGKDVFLNITGGISSEDPALDLAVVAAILSSYHDIALPKNCCFAAEIGLSGELRPVPKIVQRINEAAKLGFETLLTAPQKKIAAEEQLSVAKFSKIEEVVRYLFS